MDAPVIVEVPSEGPLSITNSPKSSPFRRNRQANNSTCSSQANNNYSGLDMESLEDMLRKVR